MLGPVFSLLSALIGRKGKNNAHNKDQQSGWDSREEARWRCLPVDCVACILLADTCPITTLRMVCKDWHHAVDATATKLNLKRWPTTDFLAQFPALREVACIQACLADLTPEPAVTLVNQLATFNPSLVSLAIGVDDTAQALPHLARLPHLKGVTLFSLPSPQQRASKDSSGMVQPGQLQLDALKNLPALRSLDLINTTPDYNALTTLTRVTRLQLLRQPMVRVLLPEITCNEDGPFETDDATPATNAPSPAGTDGDITDTAASTPQPHTSHARTTSSPGAISGTPTPAAQPSAAPAITGVGSTTSITAASSSSGRVSSTGSSVRASSSGSGSVASANQSGMPRTTSFCVRLGQRSVCLDGVGLLKHLESLSLQQATHAWQLPDAITGLTKLQELDVSRNCLTQLPASIGALTGLTRLELTNCCLPELPDSFSCLVALRHLGAAGNPGLQLPLGSTSLTNLTYLDLSWSESNNLGLIFQLSPEGFKSLETLNLRGTGLTELPPMFVHLESLTSLDLSANMMDQVPEPVMALKSLKHLNLSLNRLQSIPDQLCTSPMANSLTNLNLAFNQLKKLPADVGKFKRLSYLDVSANCITRLPPSLNMLSRLQHLRVSANPLPPSTITRLQELRSVEVCA